MKKLISLLFLLFLVFTGTMAQTSSQTTFCNPINIDYGYTPIPNFSEWGAAPSNCRSCYCKLQGRLFSFLAPINGDIGGVAT